MKEEGGENEAENIRVAVRCRPMNDRETREQAKSCFIAEDGNAVLTNLENPSERHEFGFDFVYGCDSAQQQVFLDIGVPILDRAFGGYNGTIFAYGQTGSGKTFSMSGVRGSETMEGLIPRMNRAIFERIQAEKAEHPQKLFLVECSFFEIYNEIIFDLLDSSGSSKKNKCGLEIKEHAVLGIYVKDLQERVVENQDEVVELMSQGQQARTVGYTQMNSESSRSHSIFIIKIHQKDSTDESKNIFAKINLVDLAGSERAASTGAQGDRLKEGANINKSLSALGNVINALVEASRMGKKVFIPYRNSKLTRVLQESLGGNSLCSMLATLSPANINYIETLSTLKYASRAKSIKVNAKKNEASSQISQLNEEIAALKKRLQEQTSATLGLDPKEKDEIVTKYELQIKEMDRVRLQTWEDKSRLSKQHEQERKRLAKENLLADKKIREERTRKWKLLEEKGDAELMLRALRDLDRTPSAPGTSASTSCTEDKWLAQAQAMRVLENEAKDHRTLIMVFKDSLDKDVGQWSKRQNFDTKESVGAVVKREDSSAAHMMANQLCSKLQNVLDESKKLAQVEAKLLSSGSSLINEMMSELIRFKELRSVAKSKRKQTDDDASGNSKAKQGRNTSKDEEQIMEERENGMSIALSLIQRQRGKLVSSMRAERQKMFNVETVTAQFVKYLASRKPTQLGDGGGNEPNAWMDAKAKLIKACEEWASEIVQPDKYGEHSDVTSFAPKGEVTPLGLESNIVCDEHLHTSSRKTDAKYVRLNSPHFWIPEKNDQVPFVVVDLQFPRFIQSVQIRGGDPSCSTHALSDTSDAAGTSSSIAPTTEFKLKETQVLIDALTKYKTDEISGDYELTYELLSHVMSWEDLLKTTVVPVKLFARPPVRFIHDITSVIIHNTGYARDLFTPMERDYANLSTKPLRAEYVSKIVDFVQLSFQEHESAQAQGASTVVVAATASNILAGKEPVDTLKFLCYFGLAAMRHCIKNPAQSTLKLTAPNEMKPIDSEVSNDAEKIVDGDRVQSNDTNNQSDEPAAPSSGWVTKVRVSTSLTGSQWQVIGDFDGNIDAESVKTIHFDSTSKAVGRFVQLTYIEWHNLPLLQVELYGQEARESDNLSKSMDQMATTASVMIQELLAAATLLAEDTRTSWERAKVVEREKQEEFHQLEDEIKKLKQANTDLERTIKNLQHNTSALEDQVKTEENKVNQEKNKIELLQKEMQETAMHVDELVKEKEVLLATANEHAHSIQKITLQLSEQRKEMESLHKSKTDLEDLNANLRTQLQSKDQAEGHQESKFASALSDLMAVNVQLDEIKRKYDASEQMRKEQEIAGEQTRAQLQQQLILFTEKERQAQDSLKSKLADVGRELELLRNQRDDIERKGDEIAASNSKLEETNKDLQAQLQSMRDEIESLKQDAAAKAEAESVDPAESNAAVEAGERMLLEAQTKELRCIAELEKMELKVQAFEQKQREAESMLAKTEQELNTHLTRISTLEEQEEELHVQIQIVTEERDAARLKEEQLFVENNEKEQEIERIRDGYVWVTDRMNSKEDELAEMQEQLEKYQALIQITSSGNGVSSGHKDREMHNLVRLIELATGEHSKTTEGKSVDELMHTLVQWIEQAHASASAIVAPVGDTPPATHTPAIPISSESEPDRAVNPPESAPMGLHTNTDEELDAYDDDFDADDTSEFNRLRRKVSPK